LVNAGATVWEENPFWDIYTKGLRAAGQITRIHQFETRHTRYEGRELDWFMIEGGCLIGSIL